jgi:hypothetical protein
MDTISVLLKWWRNYIRMQHTFIVSPAEVSRMQAMKGLNPDRGWCWPPISTRRLEDGVQMVLEGLVSMVVVA